MDQQFAAIPQGKPKSEERLSEDDRQLSKAMKAFESLILTDGWKLLVQVLDARQQNFAREVIFNEMSEKETDLKKGAIRELAYVVGLPETTIAQAKASLNLTSQHEDD